MRTFLKSEIYEKEKRKKKEITKKTISLTLLFIKADCQSPGRTVAMMPECLSKEGSKSTKIPWNCP